MSIQTVQPMHFDFFSGKSIDVQPSPLAFSADAGLIPLRQFDHQIGLTQQLADALHDPRNPRLITHSFAQMLRSRIFGILADHPDQNDHTILRTDPVFRLIVGLDPHQEQAASQPTLCRFENFIDIPSLWRCRDVFIDQYIASFAKVPRRVLIDMDAVDDPAHGQQQLVFYHGFYKQHQYMPLIVTCGDTGQVIMASLRAGNSHNALAADDDLRYLVERLRQAWPDVLVEVRGDAGFGMPWMYHVCEAMDIQYTFGLSANAVLHRESEALQAQALQQFQQSGEPQRLFTGFWYQATGWPHRRWVVVKAEAHAQGINRRYIVTNRPGAQVCCEASYDAYTERGESENRNKELKCGCQMDRLSDHRFLANYFRLYLHAAALNLLIRLRRELPQPEALALEAEQEDHKSYENQCRREAPLGKGQPCTWRSLLIKVACVVKGNSRRILVELSGSWPHLNWYHQVSDHVANRPAVAHLWTG